MTAPVPVVTFAGRVNEPFLSGGQATAGAVRLPRRRARMAKKRRRHARNGARGAESDWPFAE